MTMNTRLYLGIALLVLGLVMPFGVVVVALVELPALMKAVISGILFFGFEIMAIPAVAVMGKDNF